VPVIANAMRSAWRDGILDPGRLVADALRFESPVLNRRLGFFMDLYEMPATDPLALHIGRKSAVPLAPGREPEAGTTRVNTRWLVYEEPGHRRSGRATAVMSSEPITTDELIEALQGRRSAARA